MRSHAEANYDSTASSPSPETEVLGKAGNRPVAGSTSNELPQVSLPTDSAQGQPLSPADLVSEVMTDLMANDTFHEKMMAIPRDERPVPVYAVSVQTVPFNRDCPHQSLQ